MKKPTSSTVLKIGTGIVVAGVIAGGLYFAQHAESGEPATLEEISTPIESVISTPKPEVAANATLETESVNSSATTDSGGDTTN